MISFDREVRTPHSESYTILDDGQIVGRVDLHMQAPNIHATLCTTGDASDDRIRELIDAVDEQLAMTADPFREDFIVTVWKGVPPASTATPKPATTPSASGRSARASRQPPRWSPRAASRMVRATRHAPPV